jgi:hypothetical protein
MESSLELTNKSNTIIFTHEINRLIHTLNYAVDATHV